MTAAAAIGVLCFALFAGLHLLSPRVTRGIERGPLALKLVPAFALLIAVVAAAGAPPGVGGTITAVLWGELAFLGLVVLYMPLIYTLTHSLSVETLRLLASRPDGHVEEERLAATFTSPAFIEARLAGMAAGGYIAPAGSGYRLTRRGKAVARGFDWLKSLWLLGPGG